MTSVNIIGAGLAGSEASLFLAKRGFSVNLYEMKSKHKAKPYSLDSFCELVCNNLICNLTNLNPLNMLYQEVRLLGSEVVKLIEKSRIEDDNCVAVYRDQLSKNVTSAINCEKNIRVIETEIEDIPVERPTILATGPLTTDLLREKMGRSFGKLPEIIDANSIILDFDSIDISVMEKVSDDVYYLHLTGDEYYNLENMLKVAETIIPHTDKEDFNTLQCLPIEVLATEPGKLAESKLEPQSDKFKATIILRRVDKLANSIVISEFTTRIKHKAQNEIIRTIRGLEKAKIIRYGEHHYDTFIDSPNLLNDNYEVKKDNGLYVIGQLSGIDGYLSAISSGIVAARSIIANEMGETCNSLPSISMIGALSKYISTPSDGEFNPMVPKFELLSNFRLHEKPSIYTKKSLLYLSEIIKNEIWLIGESNLVNA